MRPGNLLHDIGQDTSNYSGDYWAHDTSLNKLSDLANKRGNGYRFHLKV